MYKFEDHRYYNAGENAFHRWGKKAQERVKNRMIPNEKGYYEIEVEAMNGGERRKPNPATFFTMQSYLAMSFLLQFHLRRRRILDLQPLAAIDTA